MLEHGIRCRIAARVPRLPRYAFEPEAEPLQEPAVSLILPLYGCLEPFHVKMNEGIGKYMQQSMPRSPCFFNGTDGCFYADGNAQRAYIIIVKNHSSDNEFTPRYADCSASTEIQIFKPMRYPSRNLLVMAVQDHRIPPS